ncbi:hypothetical protein [Pseudomonas weihenstephanensis]|uniref:hypothetical protein n=1 Tax=Pseudomonas TaxID=286 RepID=UPI00193C3977|nr:hypothetical protein [Pseudomonas weihenstephanensis]MBM1191557.1 hypothetical protein [Pseudomonas weihenstephanensis]
MASVTFLDGEEDIPEIIYALKSCGIAVLGCMRTRAPELRELVSKALDADKVDDYSVINFLLPLIRDGVPWHTTVFFYDAKHSYRPGSSIALVGRAFNAWIEDGQKSYYFYNE